VAADYALQRELLKRDVTLDYCLGDPPAAGTQQTRLDFMKLHGSLNWARCPDEKCDGIQVCNVLELAKTFRHTGMSAFAEPVTLDVLRSVEGSTCPVSKQSCVGHPLIVPPTWSKTQHYQRIARVWKRAAQNLSDAENIVVIGYSLTPTDQSFAYLYALGTVGDTWLKRFIVVDSSALTPLQRTALEERYRSLLGPAVAPSRFDIRFESFDWAIGAMADLLKG
jgi:hypothetical protein